MSTLTGRTAIMTGASKGIGAGIALQSARDGARVAVNFTNDSVAAQRVVDEILRFGGAAEPIQADVSNEADVRRLFATTRETLGPVDLLVNNAGVWNFEPITEVTVDAYRRHYDTNVLGNILTSREFALSSESDGGTLINMTSVGIGPASPGNTLDIGTKAAIAAMTKILAVEFAPRRSRLNAIAAGLVDTEGTRSSGFMGSEYADEFVKTIPLQRAGAPSDIGPLASFLASEAAGYITGQIVFADGGLGLI